MCGIVGQVRSDDRPVERALVDRMCKAVEHRGPDARGIHLAPRAGLGIQRLRIIDLTTGDQPIFNEDGSVVVVLNGEIYNFRALRDRLRRSGHVLATESDTEVIAHLYEEAGPSCVRSLHGMFAFAIWDSAREQLTLGRDRLGKKPLFYALRGGSITFGSEINALLEDSDISRDLDLEALDSYLALHYVPHPMTAFRAIRKLPPASTLVYRSGTATLERYWELRFDKKEPVSDPHEISDAIREHLRRAVRQRLVSDVPVGAFLSGGIDSSAVVAAMAEALPEPVKTFSLGFENDRFNELPRARLIAQHFSTEHREFLVRPDALTIVPKVVHHYGEPFGDASAIPTFYLAQLAREHVTVALTGDGGDEGFAGYNRYVSNMALHRMDALPRLLRRAGAALGNHLPAGARIDSPLTRARRLSRLLDTDPVARYVTFMSSVAGFNRGDLYTEDFAHTIREFSAEEVIAQPWRSSTGRDLLDVMLDVDVQTYLPGDLLTKMDVATMAYSLEARSPLLDHQFLEFCASLPSSVKVRGMQKKVGLREALRGWIPEATLDMPKRGFEVPIAEWFRNELREFVHDTLLGPAALARGYFRADSVRRLVEGHVAGVADHSRGIWSLLMFELWHEAFVDHRGSSGRDRAGSVPLT